MFSFFKRIPPAPRPAAGFADPDTYRAASEQIQAGRGGTLFKKLNRLKARQVPQQNVDLLRAHYFVGLNQLAAAIEAVKEELRYFPKNAEARRLRESLGKMETAALPADAPAEFAELLAAVRPYTMLSVERLYSLYALARSVCEQDLPGDFVECGVAAGGSSALLATVIARHSKRPRHLWSCDTFAGMPEASAADTHLGQKAEDSGWGKGTCAAPADSLLEVCAKLKVRELVTPLKGLFSDTLPGLAGKKAPIALLHLDGNWYSSTRDILDNLYDLVVAEGALQIDDFGHWDGCRRAVHDFEGERGLIFDLNVIDGTGVWTRKPAASVDARPARLNIGCGRRFHPEWRNFDFVPAAASVRALDVRQSLPFGDATVDAVYCSHVLEHLTRSEAAAFVGECSRVLRPGGVIRIVVPDLETIARLYVANLDAALAGDRAAADRHEWMTLELLDQLAREQSGGEMRNYWLQNPMPAEDFVIERMGDEVQNVINELRSAPVEPPRPAKPPVAAVVGNFRLGGEVHKWMYDRLSLARLLTAAGFDSVEQCGAAESRIAGFAAFALDADEAGRTRKPDSLFIEASRASQ